MVPAGLTCAWQRFTPADPARLQKRSQNFQHPLWPRAIPPIKFCLVTVMLRPSIFTIHLTSILFPSITTAYPFADTGPTLPKTRYKRIQQVNLNNFSFLGSRYGHHASRPQHLAHNNREGSPTPTPTQSHPNKPHATFIPERSVSSWMLRQALALQVERPSRVVLNHRHHCLQLHRRHHHRLLRNTPNPHRGMTTRFDLVSSLPPNFPQPQPEPRQACGEREARQDLEGMKPSCPHVRLRDTASTTSQTPQPGATTGSTGSTGGTIDNILSNKKTTDGSENATRTDLPQRLARSPPAPVPTTTPHQTPTVQRAGLHQRDLKAHYGQRIDYRYLWQYVNPAGGMLQNADPWKAAVSKKNDRGLVPSPARRRSFKSSNPAEVCSSTATTSIAPSCTAVIFIVPTATLTTLTEAALRPGPLSCPHQGSSRQTSLRRVYRRLSHFTPDAQSMGSSLTLNSNTALSSASSLYSPGKSTDLGGNRFWCEQMKRMYRKIAGLEAALLKENDVVEEDVDSRHSVKVQPSRATQEKWPRLVHEHKQLAEPCHNFLSFALKPQVPATLQVFPAKSNIPARLWNHAFHRLLMSLHRASYSAIVALKQLSSFIIYAYGFYTSLLEEENLAQFRIRWLEALGDLSSFAVKVVDALRVEHGYALSVANGLDPAGDLEQPRCLEDERVAFGTHAAAEFELEDNCEIWRKKARKWYTKSRYPWSSERSIILQRGMLFTRIQLNDFHPTVARFKERVQLNPLEVTGPEWTMMAVLNIAAVLDYGRGERAAQSLRVDVFIS
ncbi:hypothetical protein FRB90_000219 [Tulasnella sp. 427]|nr:hypothetical protein FRB90_000219 [Tulasnella sp. 427]